MSAKSSFLSGSSDKTNQQHSSGKEQSGKSKLKLSITANTAHDDQKDLSAKDKDKDKEAAGDDKKQTNEDKFKQFEDDGVIFKAKLIGSELVMEPRGDKMCQNSIQRLKAIIKGQKAHKKRIVMKVSYKGVRVFDEKTNELLYEHEVPQISFISSDDTDSRTFGYVCDVPNKAHQFICFKTSGPAIQVMTVISSLFEAVLDKKKKEEDKSQEQVGGATNNNNNNTSNVNNNIFDDDDIGHNLSQLIIQDKSSTPPAIPEEISTIHYHNHQQQQPPATTTITTPEMKIKKTGLDATVSFSSPLDLIDAGDSGIVDINPSGLNSSIFPISTSAGAPLAASQSQPNASSTLQKQERLQQLHNQQLHQQQRLHRLYTQQQQQPSFSSSFDRPNLLPLSSSSPVDKDSAQQSTSPPFSSPNLNRLPGSQNRSLIYNHSSVSLNDAALSTSRSSLLSPGGSSSAQNDSTDKYAVFNDIDNLPSIFESTSSLGSKTNLTTDSQAPSSTPNSNFNMPLGASAATTRPGVAFGVGGGGGTSTSPGMGQSSFGGAAKSCPQTGGFTWEFSPSDKQSANTFFASSAASSSAQMPQGSFPYNNPINPPTPSGMVQFAFEPGQDSNHQQAFNRPTPTPSMTVPINQSAPSTSGMVFGSAPMNAHQMSAPARFSSSMVAGLHQRLGSSAASIHSVSSATGLSRQTNPFDDDFFS